MKLRDRLLLFEYISWLLGAKGADLRADLEQAESGRRGDGQSHYFSRLESRGALVEVGTSKLKEYDLNILRIEEQLGKNRPEFRFTYFQYLAALYAEAYLDRLSQDPDQFLKDLENHRRKHFKDMLPDKLKPADLRTAALWMATGSGKTLLAHANLLQFERYKPFEPDNIIFLTPNETLSDQHLVELALSGIPAHHAVHDPSGSGVQVLEITKLYVDSRDGEMPRGGISLPTSAFEGQNLVLVDEGHKGSTTKGDQTEERKWRDIRDHLAGEQGFTFEYSATFAQITEKNDELLDEYSKTILFDYGYKHFWGDGYGKDFRVVNLKEEGAFDVDELLLAGLLVQYEQARYFADEKAELDPYNIEAPLMVFVGSTVTGKVDAEVLQIVKFLDRVLREPEWVVDRIGALLSGTSELPTDLFTHDYPYVDGLALSSEDVYDDLCRRLYHGRGRLSMHVIRRADGEIGLRTADAAEDAYCGVINVGNASKLFKNAVEAGIEGGEDDHITESVFDSIDDADSSVSFLVGAKKFIEGWSSWRVSVMGLLKVGRSAGPQVIQLFGRGVRLKGEDMKLKRSSAVLGDHPEFTPLLETLHIFGLKADYVQAFIKAVGDDDVRPPVTRILPISIRDDLDALELKAPDSGSYDFFTDDVVVFDPAQLRQSITVDLMPTFTVSEGVGEARQAAGEAVGETAALPAELVDTERLYLELLDYKRRRNMYNTYITREAVKLFLKSKTEIVAPKWVFAGADKRSFELLQSAAVDALKKGLERFVYTQQRKRETAHLSAEPIAADHANFPTVRDGDRMVPAYRLEVPEDIVREFDALIAEIAAGTTDLEDLAEPLPRLHLDRHLYNPILVKDAAVGQAGQQMGLIDAALRSVPSGLVDSEVKFLRDLREVWESYSEDEDWAGFEIYLLRNLPRKGVGFFQTAGFYPDFMLWLKKGGFQALAFVEPHGMVIWDQTKVDLLADIGRMGLTVPTRAYIVTMTPPRSIGAIGGGTSDVEWLRQRHILFQNSTEYVEEILVDLRRSLDAVEHGQYEEGDPVGVVRMAEVAVLQDQDVAEELRYVEYLPLFSLEAAAGYFGAGHDVERDGWLRVDGRLSKSMFVAQAVGRSMEPTINDGDLCVFRRYRGGSRGGRIVLAQWTGPDDPETGGSYAVKRYASEKRVVDGRLEGYRVALSPANPDFDPIELTPEFQDEVAIVAEFVEVLTPPDH